MWLSTEFGFVALPLFFHLQKMNFYFHADVFNVLTGSQIKDYLFDTKVFSMEGPVSLLVQMTRKD